MTTLTTAKLEQLRKLGPIDVTRVTGCNNCPYSAGNGWGQDFCLHPTHNSDAPHDDLPYTDSLTVRPYWCPLRGAP